MLTLADIDSNAIPVVAIAIGGGIAICGILFGSIKSISHRSQVEKSRREIAAYVAEGSMTPEEGERLLNAGAKEAK